MGQPKPDALSLLVLRSPPLACRVLGVKATPFRSRGAPWVNPTATNDATQHPAIELRRPVESTEG